MKQYTFLKTKWGKAVFGLLLLGLLMLSRDTLTASSLVGFAKSQFLMLGGICVLGLCFLAVNRRDWKQILTDPRVLAMVAVSGILLVPMVLKRDWQLMYFSILLCLLVPVFLTYFSTYREIAKYYVVLLVCLGLYSVIATYGLKELSNAGKLSVDVIYNSNGWDFYNYGLAYVVPWEAWHRNFGIFREPGVYQFFLLLAMYLNHYAVDWKKAWLQWLVDLVLIVTMVSTFAVGGYIEMALFFLFLYFDKKWYRDRWGKRLGIAAALAVLGVIALILIGLQMPLFGKTIFYDFYDMFLRLTTKSNSLMDRLDAIFVSLELYLYNPMVGDTISNVLHGTLHNTSSTLILFAVMGTLGGGLHVASWVALLWKKERSLLGNLILMVILFMSFNTQNLVANIFFWLFPMMALTERGLPMLGKKV